MRKFLHLLIPLAIAGITFTLFARAIPYGLTNIDDYIYVWKYAEVTDGFSWKGLHWAFTNLTEAIWMPLTWLSYQLDFALFGHASHLTSILVHSLNAALVYLFFTQLLQSSSTFSPQSPCTNHQALITLTSSLLTLFWSLHPLRVESVVWIASRKDVLSFTGLALALIFWVDRRTVLSQVCFVLGALAKPSVMSFPILAFILDWYVLGRRDLKRRWPVYVAPALIAAAVAAEGALAQRIGGATATGDAIPLLWRLLNAAAAYGLYLWHTVCPTGLAVQCTLRYPAPPRFLLPGVIICAAVGWTLWKRFRGGRDLLVAGLLWFTVAVGPMLGIASFGFHAFADRFTYIPALGLSLVILHLLTHHQAPGTKHQAPLLLLLCLFSFFTCRQIAFWQNDKTLLTHTIEVDGPRNANAQLHLGRYYWEFEHDVTNAVACFRACRETNPATLLNQPQFYMFALCEAGLLDEALEYKKFLAAWNEAVTADERMPGEPIPMTQRYALAYTALVMTEASGRCNLEEQIDGAIALRRGNQIRDWLYLKGRLALLDGDDAKARRIWSSMPDATNRQEDPYMLYRYLR